MLARPSQQAGELATALGTSSVATILAQHWRIGLSHTYRMTFGSANHTQTLRTDANNMSPDAAATKLAATVISGTLFRSMSSFVLDWGAVGTLRAFKAGLSTCRLLVKFQHSPPKGLVSFTHPASRQRTVLAASGHCPTYDTRSIQSARIDRKPHRNRRRQFAADQVTPLSSASASPRSPVLQVAAAPIADVIPILLQRLRCCTCSSKHEVRAGCTFHSR